MRISNLQGFTFIESMVVLGIIVLLFATALPIFRDFQTKQDLKNDTRQIISVIRDAQLRTLASESFSQWGVYFATSTTPQTYTLFLGVDYASRDTKKDEVYDINDNVEIDLTPLGSGDEIVFAQLSGLPTASGSIDLELISDPSQTATIYINSTGQISLSLFPAQSGAARERDARHVHFDYSRVIDIATSTSESLVLEFAGGSTVETINISENIESSQFFWEDEVDVGGDTQTLIIHTLRLNDPDTLFCVHRNRSLNNVNLDIDISDDLGSTPNLVGYSSDGLSTATGSSIMVGGPEWQ